MSQLFITALIDVQIDGNFDNGFDLFRGLKIATCTKPILKQLDRYFSDAVGNLEFNHIKTASAIIFSVKNKQIVNAQKELVEFLRYVQLFQTVMWLCKDNSVNCELAFARQIKNNNVVHDSNSLGHIFTKSDGKSEVTSFSSEEIATCKKIGTLILSPSSKPNVPTGGTAYKKGVNRLEIFSYLLQCARATSDIAMKIMIYCMALESIFSSSHTELSHQLSERTAFFVGETAKERREIFHFLKKAYTVRSIVTHGGTLNHKLQSSMIDISKKCDAIIRNVYSKIISDIDLLVLFGSSKPIDEYFFDKIFGEESKIE